MFRVSRRGEGIDGADTIEGAQEIVRGQSPGRYDVDEIRAEPLHRGTPADPGAGLSGIRTVTLMMSRGRGSRRSRDRRLH
jgi:hypothetical protein